MLLPAGIAGVIPNKACVGIMTTSFRKDEEGYGECNACDDRKRRGECVDERKEVVGEKAYHENYKADSVEDEKELPIRGRPGGIEDRHSCNYERSDSKVHRKRYGPVSDEPDPARNKRDQLSAAAGLQKPEGPVVDTR